MKNLLAFIIFFAFVHNCLAQKAVEKKDYIIDDISERYQATVDSNNAETKVGAYTANRGKKVVAKGQYQNGKRSGIWHFYNYDGKEMQQYDYDNSKLLLEAPETAQSNIHYRIDYTLTDKDKVSQPIKPGGRYFGYLPYVKLMRRIHDLRGLDPDQYLVVLRLLVSPLGRLADCTVELTYRTTGQTATYVVDADVLPESDKQFIPATFNGQAVASRVEVLCQPDDDGEINILQVK